MTRSRTFLVSSAALALALAPAGALAKGGASGGGKNGGGTTTTPAPSVGSISQVSTVATCSDGYTFSVTFRKGFNKRVEEVLTFANQPEGYWSFRLRNETDNLPMGGFASGSAFAPSRQITSLTTTVPVGATTLTLTGERSAFVSAAQIGPIGPVEATCTASATVVGK